MPNAYLNKKNSALDCAPFPIAVVVGDQVEPLNAACVAAFGTAAPVSLAAWIHPGDLEDATRDLATARAAGGAACKLTCRSLAEGAFRTTSWRLVAAPEGAVYAYGCDAADDTAERRIAQLTEELATSQRLLTARDVSDRRAIEARVLQSDRIVSIGTMAAGIAHELNNPLAYIVGNVEVAAERIAELAKSGRAPAADLADVRGALDEALRGAERVRAIVRDVKVFSRADDGEQREVITVETALTSALQLANNEIRHRARLVRNDEPVPRVLANEARLAQVFLNVLLNAAHAIPEGNAEAHEIRVTTGTSAQGHAIVEIADTGVGIAPENLHRVFDPFFTTKPIGFGVGLGLSICQGIVASLGGEIQVDSQHGVGTTFRVIIPAHVAAAREPPTEPATTSRAGPVRGTVLVIDDDDGVRAMLRRILSREHDVDVLPSGRAALEDLAELRRYDVIICDLMMPDVTGMDLYARASAFDATLADRFVFITGGAFTAGARAFIDSCPNRKLDKPFDIATLRRVVAGAVSDRASRPR